MIDRTLISGDKLIAAMLDSVHGNVNHWWRLLEIVPDYMPPFPRDSRPSIQVRCLVDPSQPMPGPGIVTSRHSYLRASGHAGWKAFGYFWDNYGTAWLDIEHAFLAAVHAPVPPNLLKPLCWNADAFKGQQP